MLSPPLDLLRKQLSSIPYTVHSQKDAVSFLARPSLGKSPADRFISWLLIMDRLPPDENDWALTMWHLMESHKGKVEFFQRVPVLAPAHAKVEKDTARLAPFFYVLASHLGINSSMATEFIEQVNMLLSMAALELPEHQYTQGFDRYAFISLALSLHFCTLLGFGKNEANSFALIILKAMIVLADNGSDTTLNTVSVTDRSLAAHHPQLIDVLHKGGINSAYFLSLWEDVAFADSHNAAEIYVIWDTLFLHAENYSEYFRCFVSAHLFQVPMSDDPMTLIQSIQNHTEWDFDRLMSDAHSLFSPEMGIKQFLRWLL